MGQRRLSRLPSESGSAVGVGRDQLLTLLSQISDATDTILGSLGQGGCDGRLHFR